MSRSLGEILGRTFKNYGLNRGLNKAKAVTLWPEAVGIGIAKMTKASRLEGDVLVVEASDSTVAHHLGMQRHKFVERLNTLLGKHAIRDIRFVQGYIPPRYSSTLPKPSPLRLPVDSAHVQKLCQNSHPELKDLTQKAAEALLYARAERQQQGYKPCRTCQNLSPDLLCQPCLNLTQNPQVQALVKRLTRDPDLQFKPEQYLHITEEGLSVACYLASQQLYDSLKTVLLEVLQSREDPFAVALLKTQAYSALALDYRVKLQDIGSSWHNKLPMQVVHFL